MIGGATAGGIAESKLDAERAKDGEDILSSFFVGLDRFIIFVF